MKLLIVCMVALSGVIPPAVAADYSFRVDQVCTSADNLVLQKRYDDAEELLVAEISKSITLSSQREASLRLVNKLIRLYYALRKFEAARKAFPVSLKLIVAVKGKHSIEFAQALANYIELCVKLDDYEATKEAVETYVKLQNAYSTQQKLLLESENKRVAIILSALREYRQEQEQFRQRQEELARQEYIERYRRFTSEEAESSRSTLSKSSSSSSNYVPPSTNISSESHTTKVPYEGSYHEDYYDTSKYWQHGRQYDKFGGGATKYSPGVNATPGVNSTFGR
jgi:tetratricopeptide (TPR) repeat protein